MSGVIEIGRTQVYPGPRWRLLCGSYTGAQRFAVDELQRMAQACLPYVLEVGPAPATSPGYTAPLILVGTVAEHALLRRLAEAGVIAVPDRSGGYTIAALDAPWQPPQRLLLVAGADAAGVLHGVADLNTRVLGGDAFEERHASRRRTLDELKPFGCTQAPRVDDRGIWTWGYVIYDYRRFLDNMARLRMNLLTIWNDAPPVNAPQIVEYAHQRGVRVVWGFHWGWGARQLNLADATHVAALKRHVLETYERDYAGLPHDGIYFQTVTEHHDTMLAGAPLARRVCAVVNEIGGALLERHPRLWIQFGLHATSIREHWTEFAALDPRITITWEDAGVIPYAYWPLPDFREGVSTAFAKGLDNVERTIGYSRQLAALRGGQEFAMVAKGFGHLRWGVEFENHGPFILGERSPRFVQERHAMTLARWQRYNGYWLAHLPAAARFYREVLAAGPRRTLVTALVEDSLFEASIQPAIALFAHLLWDPDTPEPELIRRAFSAYYREMEG